MDDATIICRCEDVTYGEVKKAIVSGLLIPGDIRKYTRAGMGSCQGRTCQRLLMQMLKEYSDSCEIAEDTINIRTPIQPISITELSVWDSEINEKE